MSEIEFAQQHPWTAALIVVVIIGLLSVARWALEPPPKNDWDW